MWSNGTSFNRQLRQPGEEEEMSSLFFPSSFMMEEVVSSAMLLLLLHVKLAGCWAAARSGGRAATKNAAMIMFRPAVFILIR